MHAAPNPAPPVAPAKNEVTGEKKEPRRRVPLKGQRNAITMVSDIQQYLLNMAALTIRLAKLDPYSHFSPS